MLRDLLQPTTDGGVLVQAVILVVLVHGIFAKNYGPMTPVGLLLGHVAFGLVVALVYGGLS